MNHFDMMRAALEEARYEQHHSETYQQGVNAMPKLSEMIPSKYLKGADVPAPILVHITGVHQVDVAAQGEPQDLKWAVSLNEFEKLMILNSTNMHIAATACGSEDTDDWINKPIGLVFDPNVSYGGKLVGGLRFRIPTKKLSPLATPAAAVKPPAGHPVDMNDDVPF